MTHACFSFVIACIFVATATAQDMDRYSKLVDQAKELYKNKAYGEAGEKFSDAFATNGGKGVIGDRYMAASAWAMAGQPDSAFLNLFKIVDSGYYTDKSEVVSDSTFTPLHTDNRWGELIEKLNLAEAKLDKPLIAMLDTIFYEDQMYRQQSDSIEKQYGRDSEELKAHWDMIAEKDSINLVKVQRVLDERGWLGKDVVGPQGNQTLFLVIQHADLKTQQKYIPMMREAVKKGNANGAELAMLEDRVALRTGKRQIYGSQLWRDPETGEFHVMPLEDPDKVDERRSSVGLGKLADYISIWDLKWDADAYKKILPELEKKIAQQDTSK